MAYQPVVALGCASKGQPEARDLGIGWTRRSSAPSMPHLGGKKLLQFWGAATRPPPGLRGVSPAARTRRGAGAAAAVARPQRTSHVLPAAMRPGAVRARPQTRALCDAAACWGGAPSTAQQMHVREPGRRQPRRRASSCCARQGAGLQASEALAPCPCAWCRACVMGSAGTPRQWSPGAAHGASHARARGAAPAPATLQAGQSTVPSHITDQTASLVSACVLQAAKGPSSARRSAQPGAPPQ